MKHNSTTSANGLHTPPCGSSQSKSTRFSLLTSLLLFFLLFVGSNAAWAWNVRGEGLPGLNTCTNCGNWDSNIVDMVDIGNNTFCATFLNVAAESSNRYRFKVCDGWKGTEKLDQSKSNVNFVSANETQISFTLPYESDVYVFYNSNTDKIWVIACPISTDALQAEKSSTPYTMNEWGLNSSNAWKGNSNDNPGAAHLTAKGSGSSNYSMHTISYIVPRRKSDETTAKIRYELYNGTSSTATISNKSPGIALTTSTRRVILLWDGTSGSNIEQIVPTYPIRKAGWDLYVNGTKQGTTDANGNVTVNNLSSGNITFYFCKNETKKYHGINWFGGLYIDESNSSGVSFTDIQYYKSDKINTFTKPIVSDRDATGKFTISGGAKDVTFNFDGGVITINAVDHVEALTGDFYVYGAGSNAQNWVTGWSSTEQGGGKSNPANHMTISSNVARKTYYGVKGDNLEFKVSDGTNDVGIWSNYSTSKQSGVSASANGNNIRFSLANASDVTVCYDGSEVWLEVKERQQPNSAWRVTGSFNGWNMYNEQMSDDATNRCKTVTINNISKEYDRNNHGWIRFKLFAGTAWDNSITANNATVIGLDGVVIGTVSDDKDGDDGRIIVQVDETCNLKFCYYTYSNGTNIVTVQRIVPEPVATVHFDGHTLIYFNKGQKLDGGGYHGDFPQDNAHCYLYVWDANNSNTDYSAEAFLWDDNVLAALMPEGDWTHCIAFRRNSATPNIDGCWNKTGNIQMVEGKNYLNDQTEWAEYTPKFYVTGTLIDNNWNYNGDGTQYTNTATFEAVTAGQYKSKLNPLHTYGEWEHALTNDHVNTTASMTLDATDGNKNITFTLARTSDVVITYSDAAYPTPITITATPYKQVTFDANNGSANTVVYTKTTVSAPDDPVKDGFDFAGWKVGSSSGEAYDFSATVTEDITLVAAWDAVAAIYDVIFMDGETELTALEQHVVEGNHAEAPAVSMTKDGYNFVEWRAEGESISFDFANRAINNNTILYAIWSAKTLTGISLDQTNIVMVLGGDAVPLTPSYEPADLIPTQQPTYEWSVAPAGVVNVSNAGVVTAVAEGSATITCTAQGTDKSATCNVTVKDCDLYPTNIFSYSLSGDAPAGCSVEKNSLFDPSDNTEPEELTKVRILLHDNAGNTDGYFVYAPDANTSTHLKYGNQSGDNAYWYVFEVGKTGSNLPIYALQNVSTGNYLAKAEGYQGGNWGAVWAVTANTYVNNTMAQWHWAKSSDQDRLMNVERSNGDATRDNGEYFLTRDGANSGGVNTGEKTVGVGGSDGHQGRATLTTKFVNATNVANPNYLLSPVDGYYRFATGASVEVTLDRVIKLNDVISLMVKNPSNAAVNATLTIGSQVEDISLAAGATETLEYTVSDNSRPESFTIASNDVNFMLKSVSISRELPESGKNPNLAWVGDAPASRMVDEGAFQRTVSHQGTGLVTYSSSNPAVATVAADGTVTPIAEGAITITASLEQDGCYNAASISYNVTITDLPKPTITITASDEMPQGSYQTVTVAQNGDGALTFEITSGTGATLTDNGDGTYRLTLAGNATNIVLTASTARTENYAQNSVTKNIGVQQCYVDGHVIYAYELTGHADATDVAATGGTYSQSNIGSEGTADNPATVELIRIKFQNDQSRFMVDPADDNIKYMTSDPDNNTDKWYKIPAGTNAYSNALYYLKNQGSGKYLYCDIAAGYLWTANSGWSFYRPKTGATLPATSVVSGNTRDAYKWFWYPHNGTEQNNLHLTVNQGYANSNETRHAINDEYSAGGTDQIGNPYIRCGKGTDQGHSGLRVVNEVVNASAANPDYFYSVTHDAREYYILNGGTVTVSRTSAFKAGDVITLNVFNRGAAAGNTIKVANNTIATNVNGAAALEYTVAAGDGIQGETSFVITPLNGYICLNSISIFRPKDEDEFINPVLTWDADLSDQQLIDRNASESSMQHAASFVAPVNASVVYSVAPAAKATVNEEGMVTLTAEAVNKDVVTVTATLPAIGCYNEASTSYEIYVKDLAEPTLSVAFSNGLKQGYAATLTVETNSDATPVLSAATGFTYGDAEHVGNVYTYPIVIGGIAESVSVHVALAQTLDFLAKEADAASDEIAVSNLQDLYDNTPAEGTLELQSNYDGQELIIDKEITINGNGHAIGNLTVETAGDLTLSGALTVNNFNIYAKAGNAENHAASGQVRNATNLTANGNAYFYYTVDPSGHVQYGWYDFTVPFPVNVMTGIAGIQDAVLNEDFVNERNYAIMEHLGDKQAAGEYSYKKFRGVMQPNKLYSITLDCSDNYNTVRFQKTNDGALVASESVTLDAHTGIDDNHSNWNGVGNGTLHHANAGVSATTIQVYQSGSNSFMPVNPSEISFAIGTAFMIQEAGSMTLSQANRDLLAPRREASAQPIAVQIAREGKPFSDQLFISADELAGQAYTQGVDVAKAGNLGSAKVAQIWANAYDSKLCAHEAQLNHGRAKYALSLYAPADGSYTLTGVNVPDDCTLYLTKNGKVIWNLGYACDLDLTQGTTTEYGLLLVESPQMSTGVDNIGGKTNETTKIMRNGILYILHDGKVFNAQGAIVR